MRCMQCGKAKMVDRFSPIEADYRDERFTVEFQATVCPKCGFYFIDGKDTTELMRLLADEYRKKHGLLTSVEIKAFRDKRGETQGEFAEYICVGEASIKRWEVGAIQDKAMDELIRLKCDPVRARANAEQVTAQSFKDAGESQMKVLSSKGKVVEFRPASHVSFAIGSAPNESGDYAA